MATAKMATTNEQLQAVAKRIDLEAGDYTVELTQRGRWALAVDLLERAAKLIGVPTTAEELAAYTQAKRRYDDVESSFQERQSLAQEIEGKEAEAQFREQFRDYSKGW